MPHRIYKRENLTVSWEPDLCHHCQVCISRLPKVFDPGKRPWVNLEGASIEEIVDTVNDCPTQALSQELQDESGK